MFIFDLKCSIVLQIIFVEPVTSCQEFHWYAYVFFYTKQSQCIIKTISMYYSYSFYVRYFKFVCFAHETRVSVTYKSERLFQNFKQNVWRIRISNLYFFCALNSVDLENFVLSSPVIHKSNAICIVCISLFIFVCVAAALSSTVLKSMYILYFSNLKFVYCDKRM